MDHGNINDFVQENLDVNRIELVCTVVRAVYMIPDGQVQLVGVTEGLAYMHGLHLVHGDLKGVCGSIKLGIHVSLMFLYQGEHSDQQGSPGLHLRLRPLNYYWSQDPSYCCPGPFLPALIRHDHVIYSRRNCAVDES